MGEVGNINSELKSLQQERDAMPILLKQHQEKIASSLIDGKMGNSIQDAFNGKNIRKIPFTYRFKYRFKKFINNLFNTI